MCSAKTINTRSAWQQGLLGGVWLPCQGTGYVLVSTHVTFIHNSLRGASYAVQVVQFDVPVPLKSVAQITVPDASTLMIAPFDRSSLRDIEKAILESDLGINPNNDGERIRLGVPPLTQVR